MKYSERKISVYPSLKIKILLRVMKQPPRGAPMKRCSENMQQIY